VQTWLEDLHEENRQEESGHNSPRGESGGATGVGSLISSPRSSAEGIDRWESMLHTPTRPAPEVEFGEMPPAYDWVPTAQREREEADLLSGTGGESATQDVEEEVCASSDVSEDRHSYVSCYTMSLGLKKTKAEFALPLPYHVQNLIKAMAARLPQRTAIEEEPAVVQ